MNNLVDSWARVLVLASLVLGVALPAAGQVVIDIDPSRPVHPLSPYLTGACLEDVNHEVYGGLYSQMIFGESFAEPAATGAVGADRAGVSGMWRAFRRQSAVGTTAIETTLPFVGSQSQQISFTGGAGEVGIENQGLNHQGLAVLAGHAYQGHLWARAVGAPLRAAVSLAAGDGSALYASADLAISDTHWHRYDFTLTPTQDDPHARFEFRLVAAGTAQLGYVFLQPGPWGLFHGLPVRGDVAAALVGQGITVMRYGGSMVNAPQYRWKQMIGDRDHRRPYHGFWYPQSSNGWGIIDFLNFAEAAGFVPIVDFNIDQTPQDMADFLEYVNGPADSPWGRRRVADGHPAPYRLTHLELGNEQRVDGAYFAGFAAIARAIWAKDPAIILTVGDFEYTQPIVDPMHVSGATSRITDLSAHRDILALARSFDAQVWFDIHIFTDHLPASPSLAALPSYVDAIDQLANGAKHRVVVFELNADRHTQERALANAQALIRIERDGRIPVVCSANCLQVDHQNDNGWNQGLLFLNPAQVWLQPPGYAMQMFSRDRPAVLVESSTSSSAQGIETAALLSADRGEMVLQVVNMTTTAATATIRIAGHDWDGKSMRVRTLSADLAAVNTAERPDAVRPLETTEPTGSSAQLWHNFSPSSITLLRWTRREAH